MHPVEDVISHHFKHCVDFAGCSSEHFAHDSRCLRVASYASMCDEIPTHMLWLSQHWLRRHVRSASLDMYGNECAPEPLVLCLNSDDLICNGGQRVYACVALHACLGEYCLHDG